MLCVAAGKAKNHWFSSLSHDQRPLKCRFWLWKDNAKEECTNCLYQAFWFVITTPWGVSIGEADRLKCLKLRPSDLLSA
jgi:hypothetical protein